MSSIAKKFVGDVLVCSSLDWGFKQSMPSAILTDTTNGSFHALIGDFGRAWV